MSELKDLLALTYWHNTLGAYLQSAIEFVLTLVAIYCFKKIILRGLRKLAQKTDTQVDNFVVKQLDSISFIFYLSIALYLSSLSLHIPHGIHNLLLYVLITVVTLRVVLIIQAVVRFIFERALRAPGETAAQVSTLKTFNWLINAVVWSVAFLFLLSNFGININSVVAGLGIGGIAVALAAQSVLGDFFSSLIILLDKPFQIGDFVIMGDLLGTIQEIGIKNTRILSLSGEQIIIPNSQLTSGVVRNYKRMQERRVIYRIGITYQTPAEKCKMIPELLREVVNRHDQVRFDRAHFASFGDFALLYELVYYILSPDYNTFMDIQQKINFQIMDEFQSRGISFAYPTQTLYLQQPGMGNGTDN
jgi:small-conductance mechanosensitive channel